MPPCPGCSVVFPGQAKAFRHYSQFGQHSLRAKTVKNWASTRLSQHTLNILHHDLGRFYPNTKESSHDDITSRICLKKHHQQDSWAPAPAKFPTAPPAICQEKHGNPNEVNKGTCKIFKEYPKAQQALFLHLSYSFLTLSPAHHLSIQ